MKRWIVSAPLLEELLVRPALLARVLLVLGVPSRSEEFYERYAAADAETLAYAERVLEADLAHLMRIARSTAWGRPPAPTTTGIPT